MFLSLLLGIVTEARDYHETISSSDITIILNSKYPTSSILPFSNPIFSPSSSPGSACRPEKFTKVIKSAVREEGREGRKEGGKEGGKEGEKLKTVELSPFHNKRRKFNTKFTSQSILSSSQNRDGNGNGDCVNALISPSIVEPSLQGCVLCSSSVPSSSCFSCFSSSPSSSLPSSLTALLITFVNFSGLRADPDEEDGEKMGFENGNIEEEGYFELRIIVISELDIVSW